MKIKKGFVIQEVAGQWVAVATGAAAKEFTGIVKLNATAAHVSRGRRASKSSPAWSRRTT